MIDRARLAISLVLVGVAGVLLSRLQPSFATPAIQPLFEDATGHSGIAFVHQSSPTTHKYLIESMSGGIAVFDYNGDGKPDIFFVNGAALQDPMPSRKKPDKTSPDYWNRLYRNNSDGTFTDVTAQASLQGAGYGMGVAVADYDNDGWEDLYVTNLDSNVLYHNDGNGTFTNVTEKAGVQASGWSSGALFFDYDRDSLLDLFVARYVKWDFSMDIWCGSREPGHRSYCHPDQFQPVSYLVFHNKGNGQFEDVSERTRVSHWPGKGLGIAINDFDRDGLPDVFVANDSIAEQLFRNRGDGTFDEVATEKGAAYDADGRTFSGMGTDFADYDNDGWPDIFVNALARERYALFHNQKGSFDYVSESTGIGRASVLHSGWGTKFIDYDNDGWKDLFVGQGHVMDNIQLTQPEVKYLETPLLLHNDHGHFRDVAPDGGAAFQVSRAVRGVAFGDLNNDGAVDIVMNCNNGAPVILLNQHRNKNHWLGIDAHGRVSNRDGIGASIHITGESGLQQYATVTTGGSYLSASDKRVFFGLGTDRIVRSVEIAWPSGKLQRLENIKPDQVLQVTEPK